MCNEQGRSLDGHSLRPFLKDPHEWQNLAKDPAFNDVKKELRAKLLSMTGRN
jgi:hypothetical protein